jgi:hypothetical protein
MHDEEGCYGCAEARRLEEEVERLRTQARKGAAAEKVLAQWANWAPHTPQAKGMYETLKKALEEV